MDGKELEIWQADIEQKVHRAVVMLAEQADTVQIFVSRCDAENTRTYTDGYGHWYARVGQVKSWLDVETRRDIEEMME